MSDRQDCRRVLYITIHIILIFIWEMESLPPRKTTILHLRWKNNALAMRDVGSSPPDFYNLPCLHHHNSTRLVMSSVIRVTVTGAAGQVAYAMLGRLASGEVFGKDKKIILQLLEITQAMPTLEGVAMELDDCSFPTLQGMLLTDDPAKAFKDCNWALLV